MKVCELVFHTPALSQKVSKCWFAEASEMVTKQLEVAELNSEKYWKEKSIMVHEG